MFVQGSGVKSLFERVLLSAFVLFSFGASAQSVISARSGLISFFEGSVSVDGRTISPVHGRFQQVSQGSVLDTQAGRAEIVLGPNVFLWMAPHSSIRMLGNSLDDTRVELLSGAAVVQLAELLPDNAVTLIRDDAEVRLSPNGFYRLDAASSVLTVMKGEAALTSGPGVLVINEPRRVLLPIGLINSITKLRPDSLDLWVQRRLYLISLANLHQSRTWDSFNAERSKRAHSGLAGLLSFFSWR